MAFTAVLSQAPALHVTVAANEVSRQAQPARVSGCTFLRGDHGLSASTSMATLPASRRVQTPMATATTKERAAETKWPEKRRMLIQKRVKSINAREAQDLMDKKNYILLDVRPQSDYEEAHPVGAINISLYRPITEWTPYKIARRTAFAFFGIFQGTEENPNFMEEVRAAVPDKETPVIVACMTGGAIRATANLPDGRQSRSLIAAFYLALDGYTNVCHMDGGLQSWFQYRLPAEIKDN